MSRNILMMAVAKGNNSSTTIKRYIGYANVNILAINPTKAQIKDLMGYEPQEEPTYVGTMEIDGKQVNFARVDFIVKTTKESGIDYTGRISFMIRNQYRKGSQSGKYMVIDKYNNTAWATEDVVKAGKQIVYSNGPAKIIGTYRPAYVGEWQFMNFIRQFLWIGSSGETNGFDYDNGVWIEKKGENLNQCECGFSVEELQAMFKGDFTCVKDAIALQPNNQIKVLFGIKTKDNKEFQDIYTDFVMRSNASNASASSKFQEKVEEAKNNGGLQDRIYEFCPLKEYVVEATDFTTPSTDPLASSTSGTPW